MQKVFPVMSFAGCCIQSTRKDASTEKSTRCSTCIFIFFITTLLSQFNGFRTTQTHSNNWHMLVFILLAFTKTTWAVLRKKDFTYHHFPAMNCAMQPGRLGTVDLSVSTFPNSLYIVCVFVF